MQFFGVNRVTKLIQILIPNLDARLFICRGWVHCETICPPTAERGGTCLPLGDDGLVGGDLALHLAGPRGRP